MMFWVTAVQNNIIRFHYSYWSIKNLCKQNDAPSNTSVDFLKIFQSYE